MTSLLTARMCRICESPSRKTIAKHYIGILHSIRFIRVILPLTNFPVQHCLLYHLVLYSPCCPLPNLKSRKRKNKNLEWSTAVNDNPMALCFSGDFPLEAQRNLIIIEGRIYCDCGVRHPHDQTLRDCYLSQLPGCALSRKKMITKI